MAAKINQEKLKSTIASLKARFETGTISDMSDLTDFYITGLIAAIGIGYDGFVNKCTHPEKFLIEDLVKISKLIDVDVELIIKVVLKSAVKNVQPKDISDLFNA